MKYFHNAPTMEQEVYFVCFGLIHVIGRNTIIKHGLWLLVQYKL